MIDISEHGGILGGGSAKTKFAELTLSLVQPAPKGVGHLWVKTDKIPVNTYYVNEVPMVVGTGSLTINAVAQQIKPNSNPKSGSKLIDMAIITPNADSTKIVESNYFDVYAKVGLVKYWTSPTQSEALEAYIWDGSKWVLFSLMDFRSFILFDKGSSKYTFATIKSDDTVIETTPVDPAPMRSPNIIGTVNPVLKKIIHEFSDFSNEASIAPGLAFTDYDNPTIASNNRVVLLYSSSYSLGTRGGICTDREGFLYVATQYYAGSSTNNYWYLTLVDLKTKTTLKKDAQYDLVGGGGRPYNTLKKMMCSSKHPTILFAFEVHNNFLLHKHDITDRANPKKIETLTLDRTVGGTTVTFTSVNFAHMSKSGDVIWLVSSDGYALSYNALTGEKLTTFQFIKEVGYSQGNYVFDQYDNLYISFYVNSGTERRALAKYDKNGNKLWFKKYTISETFTHLSITPSGIVYLWGTASGGTTLKLDSDGNLLSSFKLPLGSASTPNYAHEAGEMASFPENW